jgi:formylglycine-generating enzyme required for sulfatase activity
MAGNVFEWCAAEETKAGRVVARGGSWAERDPRMLRVYHREWFPRDYRDADVGFRIVVESRD